MTNIQQSKREECLERMSLRIDQFITPLENGRAGIIERDIIYKCYLEKEDVCDYMFYNEIEMSECTYRC